MLKKTYQYIRNKSPQKMQSLMSKIVFTLPNNPSVFKTNDSQIFPDGYKGGLTFSADFELGWAFRYSKSNPNPHKMANRTRANFPFLLKLLNDYNVPITWATVGHLLLSECKKGDHDWMEQIPYFDDHWRFTEGDWFDCDPYTSWEKAKTWYAPDLIEKILNARSKHDIGCHTFSHIDFSYRNCPPQVARDELKACIDAAKLWNIELNSFVFPGGTYGNFEVLKEYNFVSYRRSKEYDLFFPHKDKYGLIVSPSSYGLGDNGLGWSKDYYLKRYKKYFTKAIENEVLCHIWFHPSLDEWFLKNVLSDILHYAAELREKGLLWIGTMKDMTSYIEKNHI